MNKELGKKRGPAARCLIQHWLKVICPDFQGSILVDEGNRQDKAQTAFLLHQGTLHSLHRSGFDTNSLADHEIKIGFNSFPAEIRAQKLNFAIRNRKWPLAVADNSEGAGRSKNGPSFCSPDPHEHIRREQGPNNIDALTILPDMDALVGGKKRLNLARIQMPDQRLLAFGHRIQGKPLRSLFEGGCKHRLRHAVFESG